MECPAQPPRFETKHLLEGGVRHGIPPHPTLCHSSPRATGLHVLLALLVNVRGMALGRATFLQIVA